MIGSLVGANAAIAADRTVLNSNAVTEAIEQENVDEQLTTEARAELRTQLTEQLTSAADTVPAGISVAGDAETIAEETITESYISQEIEQTVADLIAFLRGASNTLEVTINLEPIRDSLTRQFTRDSVTVETAELAQGRDLSAVTSTVNVTDEMLVQMNEGQPEYTAVRTSIRRQGAGDIPIGFSEDAAGAVVVNTTRIVTESDFDISSSRIELDDTMIVQLNEDRAGYRAVRTTLREQAIGELPIAFRTDGNSTIDIDTVALAQQISFDSAETDINVTNSTIAQLNEDQEGYTHARADIRAHVRASLPGSPTEQQVDEALREINADIQSSAADQARSAYGAEVSEATLDEIITLQATVIDGLTHPDLDNFSVYAERRDADEAALAASLDDELRQTLNTEVAELKAAAADQARSEFGADISNASVHALIRLQETVIDGLTDPDLSFSEYEARRDADEAALAASLDDDIEQRVRAEAAQLQSVAAEQAETAFGADVSAASLDAIIRLQNTVIAGLTDPDLDAFSAYESRRTNAEAKLEAALAAEIQTTVDERFDAEFADQLNIGGELTEDTDGLATIQSILSVLSLFVFVLPVLFIALVGVSYLATRAVQQTALLTGISLLVVGILGAIGGFVGDSVSPNISERGDDSGGTQLVDAGFTDVVDSIIESLFTTLLIQSIVLAVAGVVLVGGVYLHKRGHIADSIF